MDIFVEPQVSDRLSLLGFAALLNGMDSRKDVPRAYVVAVMKSGKRVRIGKVQQ
jgi:hypothetical protein